MMRNCKTGPDAYKPQYIRFGRLLVRLRSSLISGEKAYGFDNKRMIRLERLNQSRRDELITFSTILIMSTVNVVLV